MNESPTGNLQLIVKGMLRPHCEVIHNGQLATSTSTLYDGLRTSFALDRRDWRTGPHVPGGRGIDMLREIVVGGVMARPAFELVCGSAPPAATARGRGLFGYGYDLDFAGTCARLAERKGKREHVFTSALGDGLCRFDPVRRCMHISLPALLSTPQQLFVGLLALGRWIRLQNTS